MASPSAVQISGGLDSHFTPNFMLPESLKAVQAYHDVRDDDVVVCSYPGAGCQWTAELVSKLVHGIRRSEEVQPAKYEASSYETSSATLLLTSANDCTNSFSANLEMLTQLPSPRVICTQLPCDMLPTQVQQGKAKVIYIYRDPRDLAVRLWAVAKTKKETVADGELSWSGTLECFLNGTVTYGPWSAHFRSCHTVQKQRYIFVLYYEQMLEDLEGTVRKLADFLGKSLNEESLTEILEGCRRNTPDTIEQGTTSNFEGMAGQWRRTFTVAQSDQFDIKLDSERESLDPDLPYWPESQIPQASRAAPGLYKYQGVLFGNPPVDFSRLRSVYSYPDIRDDDVFVWTYPKAGSHWTMDIVNKITCDGDFEKMNASLHEYTGLEITSAPFNGKVSGPKSLEELSKLTSPRVIITHLQFRMLPKLIQQGKAKVIYVYRDPRDTAVSLFHMKSLLLKGVPGWSWPAFFDQFNDGQVTFGPWWEHFKSAQQSQHKSNVLILRFEDMKKNPKESVSRIARFMGKALNEQTIAKIADSCTIEVARQAKPNSPFVRKGVCGDWKNHFTVEQMERFDKKVQEMKKLHCLDIPY